MSSFLRLSNRILNVAHIVEIEHYTKREIPRFCIRLNKSNYDGLFLLGSGGINNQNNEIIICKYQDAEDYTRIQDWMKENNIITKFS